MIDHYIVDFYCTAAGLVVDLDGSQHFEVASKEYDAKRTAALETRGLKVVRIPNNELNQNFRGVCEYIDLVVQQRIKNKTR